MIFNSNNFKQKILIKNFKSYFHIYTIKVVFINIECELNGQEVMFVIEEFRNSSL